MRDIAAAACMITLLLGSAGAAMAQPVQATSGALRVSLVGRGGSPGRPSIEVIRRRHPAPLNVIAVDTTAATARDLAAAIALFNALRQEYGDVMPTDVRAVPESYTPGNSWEGSAFKLWVENQLGRVRAGRLRNVPGFGTVRVADVTLPATNGRVANSLRR